MSETLSDAWGVHEIGFLPSKGTCILNEIMNLTVGKSSNLMERKLVVELDSRFNF